MVVSNCKNFDNHGIWFSSEILEVSMIWWQDHFSLVVDMLNIAVNWYHVFMVFYKDIGLDLDDMWLFVVEEHLDYV